MNNTTTHPEIVVFGAGSIGCYLGGCLQAGGVSIRFIGRPRLEQQLRQHGLTLTDWRGRKGLISADKIRFSLSSEAIAKADYILVTVKSANTAEAAAQIAPYAKSSAVIVSFQNGIHNADVLQQGLAEHRVLKGMVPFNVISAGDGHFHCGTEGDLALEINDGSAQALLNALQQAQLPVQTYRDLTGIQWSKLLLNLNNAVNALSGMPLRDQLYDHQYRRLMALIVQEALEVLKAAGIKPLRTGKVVPGLLPTVLRLPTWLFKRVASALLKIDPAARSSMYEDLQLGRKTEVDYLNGEIVNLAVSMTLSAPKNATIVELIKKAERDANGSPRLSAQQLLQLITTPG